MPGRMQRRASLSAKPVRRGSVTGKGPSRVMLSWFQGSETVEEPETMAPMAASAQPAQPQAPVLVQEEIQITGLELLKQHSKTADESDDFSYDSYARDSVALAGNKVKKVRERSRCGRLAQSEHLVRRRRLSPASDDEDMDSMARDYYEYDGPPARPLPEKKWSQRRASTGSYATDSVEFGRFRSTRRSSIGSYANDSVECRNMRKSSYSNATSSNGLGTSWHGNNKYGGRRGSLGSQYGRRGSLGSQTMGSNGGRYPSRSTTRHSSHSGTVELMRKTLDGPMRRRSSLGSVSSGVSVSVASSLNAGYSRAT